MLERKCELIWAREGFHLPGRYRLRVKATSLTSCEHLYIHSIQKSKDSFFVKPTTYTNDFLKSNKITFKNGVLFSDL